MSEQELLLTLRVVGRIDAEVGHGQQVPLGGILGKDVGEEVVVAGMADAEVAVFVGKAHGHSGAAVLAAPGVEMSVLQDVVAEPALVAYKYHKPFFFLSSSTLEMMSTRPVSES